MIDRCLAHGSDAFSSNTLSANETCPTTPRQATAIPWSSRFSLCMLITKDLRVAFKSKTFRRRLCACFLPTSSPFGLAAWQLVTSDLPRFTLWRDLSAFGIQSILPGVLKFAPFRSRRLQSPTSATWKKQTWTLSCGSLTARLLSGTGIMRFSCFSTTPVHAQMKPHKCA